MSGRADKAHQIAQEVQCRRWQTSALKSWGLARSSWSPCCGQTVPMVLGHWCLGHSATGGGRVGLSPSSLAIGAQPNSTAPVHQAGRGQGTWVGWGHCCSHGAGQVALEPPV